MRIYFLIIFDSLKDRNKFKKDNPLRWHIPEDRMVLRLYLDWWYMNRIYSMRPADVARWIESCKNRDMNLLFKFDSKNNMLVPFNLLENTDEA